MAFIFPKSVDDLWFHLYLETPSCEKYSKHYFLSCNYTVFFNFYTVEFTDDRWIPGINPYPEPVYTGWSSVHWNATGMPLVDPVYTGTPLEKLSWNSPTLECHWRNLVESAPHWDATGETLTFTAYTGTPLEGLWQPTHAPSHIV